MEMGNKAVSENIGLVIETAGGGGAKAKYE